MLIPNISRSVADRSRSGRWNSPPPRRRMVAKKASIAGGFFLSAGPFSHGSAVEEHQHTIIIAAGNGGPLAHQATEIDRSKVHVTRDGPMGTNFVEALAALRPPDW